MERLGIEHPVCVDSGLAMWDWYGNEGWPARYRWTPEQALYSVHYGEGAYAETELEIGELLGIEVPLPPPLSGGGSTSTPSSSPISCSVSA